MSRTYKKEHHSSLFKNGQRGHHNTLTREFKGLPGGGSEVKNCRNLLNRRDFKSDRLGGMRRIGTKQRRTALKRIAQGEIRMIE